MVEVFGRHDNDWAKVEKYLQQVLSLAETFNKSHVKTQQPLKPNKAFVILLIGTTEAVHDNDTSNVTGGLLRTADLAYEECADSEKDRLLLAFLRDLSCTVHLCTSEFSLALTEARESLEIRRDLLPAEDYQIASSYRYCGLAAASAGQYEARLEFQALSGKVLEGPAGEDPSRQTTWKFNSSRNFYLLGRYDEADALLTSAIASVEQRKTWYSQTYGYLTMVSLRVRQGRVEDARTFVDKAVRILETSAIVARFSWLSSYCAYRAGQVAMLQNRVAEAIEQTERSVAIGKLTNVPIGIRCRKMHVFAKALARDPDRQADSERQRLEARQLRSEIPNNAGGDLEDGRDEAFEMLAKVDHR